jgi:hypothetical protein
MFPQNFQKEYSILFLFVSCHLHFTDCKIEASGGKCFAKVPTAGQWEIQQQQA